MSIIILEDKLSHIDTEILLALKEINKDIKKRYILKNKEEKYDNNIKK